MTASAPNNKELEATKRSRIRASYLGLAIGDALGATVEFMTPSEIKSQYGIHKEIVGGGWLRLKKGQVTDDTTMALALGQAILTRGTIHGPSIADAFNNWMRAKPVDIGHTVRSGIVHYRRTGLHQAGEDEMSAGNGACMRCLPIALSMIGADQDQVRAASKVQAHITHHNRLSDAGTEAVILMTQALINGSALNEMLQRFLQPLADQSPEFRFRHCRSQNPSGFIGHTLCCVFEALFDTNSFEDCLIKTVNRGGDADTTGAIAGMLAGAYYGEQAIPTRWVNNLDPTTRLSCLNQAEALAALSPVGIEA